MVYINDPAILDIVAMDVINKLGILCQWFIIVDRHQCMIRIADTIVSDNESQFEIDNCRGFGSKQYITHMTSSTKFPLSNREAEGCVRSKRVNEQECSPSSSPACI